MTTVVVTPPMLVRYRSLFAPLDAMGIAVHFNEGEYPMSAQLLAACIGDAQAAIVGLDQLTESVFAACHNLEIVARNGVGLDNVDLNAATRCGVLVTVPLGANSTSVAELTFGLMIAAARGLVANHNRVQAGTWRRDTGVELSGKTLGIIGLGNIGKRVAVRARAFEMRVLAHDIAPDLAFAQTHGIEFVSRETLLGQSDMISLHVPLTELTYHLINAEVLAQMKPGVFLVNTARGAVVDPNALAEALESGHVAGAGLDVHTVEGEIDPVLAGRENVITTTHLGAYTDGALIKTTKAAVESLTQYFQQQTPFGLVNQGVVARRVSCQQTQL
jgi:phosphoglycerate dehydrogenase-like enzyme